MEELSKSIQIVGTLKQVMCSMRQHMERHYKNINLTGPQGMLLGTLAHYGDMKISDLSEKLNLSNSTVSGILDRLEKQELIERVRCKEDRRVVYIRITPEFKKIAEENLKEAEKSIELKMNKATPEELDKILQGLESLKRLLE